MLLSFINSNCKHRTLLPSSIILHILQNLPISSTPSLVSCLFIIFSLVIIVVTGMASSILNSNTSTVVLATAMAVSGTVIVLALRLQKLSVNHLPRSCISSEGKKKGKKKKKVQFAEDVAEPTGNGEEFRKRLANKHKHKKNTTSSSKVAREMAANRRALYNGILRDRVVNRTAYSY